MKFANSKNISKIFRTNTDLYADDDPLDPEYKNFNDIKNDLQKDLIDAADNDSINDIAPVLLRYKKHLDEVFFAGVMLYTNAQDNARILKWILTLDDEVFLKNLLATLRYPTMTFSELTDEEIAKLEKYAAKFVHILRNIQYAEILRLIASKTGSTLLQAWVEYNIAPDKVRSRRTDTLMYICNSARTKELAEILNIKKIAAIAKDYETAYDLIKKNYPKFF